MAKRARQFWLFKSEPAVYSISDLKRNKKTRWDGIRNYQVRNLIRDQIQIGDLALFYHSSTKDIGVAGIMKVTSAPYPDPLQFDHTSEYYDAGAASDAPRWLSIDVAFVEQFPKLVAMQTLRTDSKLRDMVVTRKGNRLSITPVSQVQFDRICQLSKK